MVGGTSGGSGYIIFDSGSFFILKGPLANGGNFTSGETLTGQTSGATASASGNTKNTDISARHHWNIAPPLVEAEFFISQLVDDEEIRKMYWNSWGSSGQDMGIGWQDNHASTHINLQSATNGIPLITDAGALVQIDTEDWYSKIIYRIKAFA